ncbi:mechanosensitive ion channel family protein [Actinomyces vulturis]|uniref:mechanosensitive ion channel family protein n=1 Tax=Actinomyces vulturis TaxID=1857645 RepID=UPI000831812D|nr:mechanosensitive ion channel domain-containing protein [Actinomyces vulturis]
MMTHLVRHILIQKVGGSVDNATDAAVETTKDIVDLAGHMAVGILLSLIVATVVVFVMKAMGKRRVIWLEAARYCRVPLYALSISAGGWLGVQAAIFRRVGPSWAAAVLHLWLIAIIITLTCLVVAIAKTAEATILDYVRLSGDEGRVNRVTTQAQVIRRVAQVVIVLCGLVGVIMTYPSARVAMGSLLASAGLISVIAGLAAQSTLGNVFAGLQLAVTDAIRVDDVVVVQGEYGTIEEITLTYVVVHIWDDRRLILPSRYFTENPFVNWSRRGSEVTGAILMCVDWRCDVDAMRAEVQRIVSASDAWDERDARVLVTDASGPTVTARITVTGATPGDVWDLQCEVREKIMVWLQRECPEGLPRTRVDLAPPLNELH